MEGAYNRVLSAWQTVPHRTYVYYMDLLAKTVRDEIAGCNEKAYDYLTNVDAKAAKQILMFSSEQELLEYITEPLPAVMLYSSSISRFSPESQGVKDGLNGLQRGNSRKVNIDKGNVDSSINLLKSTIDLPEEVCHRKNDSQEDIPFSGPLPVSGSTGFAWAKRRKEDTADPLRSHRRSKSRALSSVSSDSFSALRCIDSSRLKDQASGNTKEQSVAMQGIMQRRGNFGLTDSFDAYEAYHSQDFSSTLSQKEQMSFKPHILNCLGFQDEEKKVDFSGPILSHSSKVDEFLEKHERHIRQAVRRSWFQRGLEAGRKDLGE